MPLYLHKKVSCKTQPQARPSGGVPEESIVIGGDSSMCVIFPEEPAMAQNVEVKECY